MTTLRELYQAPHKHYPHERCGYIQAAMAAVYAKDVSIRIWDDKPGFTAVFPTGELPFPFSDAAEFERFRSIHLEPVEVMA